MPDQSTPLDPEAFRGRLDEFLAWAEEHWPPGRQWCPRHWSPCPVDGKNGILATVKLSQLMVDAMPPHVRRAGADAMNAWAEARSGPFCCQLGDANVAAIWAGC